MTRPYRNTAQYMPSSCPVDLMDMSALQPIGSDVSGLGQLISLRPFPFKRVCDASPRTGALTQATNIMNIRKSQNNTARPLQKRARAWNMKSYDRNKIKGLYWSFSPCCKSRFHSRQSTYYVLYQTSLLNWPCICSGIIKLKAWSRDCAVSRPCNP